MVGTKFEQFRRNGPTADSVEVLVASVPLAAVDAPRGGALGGAALGVVRGGRSGLALLQIRARLGDGWRPAGVVRHLAPAGGHLSKAGGNEQTGLVTIFISKLSLK